MTTTEVTPTLSRTAFPLDAIRVDSGTQVRATVNPALVMEYAERMAEGAEFPPVVVFYDGTDHHLADGFHRYHAARQLWRDTIAADVRVGTKQDALWFALGANATQGQRLTGGDRKHAIALALLGFPNCSGAEIARQIGCSHQWVSDVKRGLQATCTLPAVVTGSDGRQYPAQRQTETTVHPLTAEILAGLKAGQSATTIARAQRVSTRTVARIRKNAGLDAHDRTRVAIRHRLEQIRVMAGGDYSTRQIAGAIGLGEDYVRAIAKREGIDLPADRIVGKTKRHQADRIVSRIVMDAENLVECVNLIDFSELDRAQIPDWLTSLQRSRSNLSAFIRRLMQESSHGEAA